MKGWFITGSGTDVGKTYITAALTRCLRERSINVRVLKPIISGIEEDNVRKSDSGILLSSNNIKVTLDEVERISPWQFRTPLSPDMAASRENKTIELEGVVKFCHDAQDGAEDILLIEGVGGVMVPLNDQYTVLDWIEATNLPTILVVGSYLGTLSHSLTAFQALSTRGITVEAIVISESLESPVSLAETAESLSRF
ncbi:MAG: dethiobiotin synthase, partial [Rhodospirillales bacterium]